MRNVSQASRQSTLLKAKFIKQLLMNAWRNILTFHQRSSTFVYLKCFDLTAGNRGAPDIYCLQSLFASTGKFSSHSNISLSLRIFVF